MYIYDIGAFMHMHKHVAQSEIAQTETYCDLQNIQ